MARPLRHGFNIARVHVLSRPQWASSQSAEALVEDKTSTGDPYANVGEAGLTFESEEAAKAFTEKHGWDYTRQRQRRSGKRKGNEKAKEKAKTESKRESKSKE
ncbi:unnamed protein product [Malus baccata var. baccata]